MTNEAAVKIEIKKCRAASVSHGRGMDNNRTPAGYDIIIDGTLRGKLFGKTTRFMALPEWEVYSVNPDGTNIRSVRPMLRSKKAAVAWITNNVARFA